MRDFRATARLRRFGNADQCAALRGPALRELEAMDLALFPKRGLLSGTVLGGRRLAARIGLSGSLAERLAGAGEVGRAACGLDGFFAMVLRYFGDMRCSLFKGMASICEPTLGRVNCNKNFQIASEVGGRDCLFFAGA